MRVATRHAALITTDRRRTPVVCRPVGRTGQAAPDPDRAAPITRPLAGLRGTADAPAQPCRDKARPVPSPGGVLPDNHGGVAGQRR